MPNENELILTSIDRGKLPRELRAGVLRALERGDDVYDDVLDVIETHRATDSAALDSLADMLYADPDRFPSGSDVCEVLDNALRKVGRARTRSDIERDDDAYAQEQADRASAVGE